MRDLSLHKLFRMYLRVGTLTFGGGDPTMAALQSEMVSANRWLTPEQYAVVYALARITPGTNLLAFCAGTAWQLLGWPGAVAAVAAVSVPASVAVVLLTQGYAAWRSNALAMAAIGGTLSAAVGMMAVSAWQLLRPQLKAGRRLRAAAIAGSALALSLGLGMSPVPVLGLAALAGFFWRTPQ